MGRLAAITALTSAGIAVAGAAPAAAATDACANAAVRAQQQSQHLPNCMAYEKITPDVKSAMPALIELVAPDGEAFAYSATSYSEGALPSFSDPKFRSVRNGDTWSREPLFPSLAGAARFPRVQDLHEVKAGSRDMGRVAFEANFPYSPNDRGAGSGTGNTLASPDVYVAQPDGTLRWVVPDPTVPSTDAGRVYFAGASPDLERIVVHSSRLWDPRHTTAQSQFYVATDSGMFLASVLPDGSVAPAGTSAPGGGSVSADARTIAFRTGATGDYRVFVRRNADDPQTASTEEVALGPNGETCTSGNLVSLSPSGRYVSFSCRLPILPGAPENSVYVRDLERDRSTLELRAKSVIDSETLGVSLVDDGATRTMSVVRGGQADVVATWPEQPAAGIEAASLSADEAFALLETERKFDLPGVDLGPPGSTQLFRVDLATGEFSCVSCAGGGRPTTGSGVFRNDNIDVAAISTVLLARAVQHPVARDGSVLFTSVSRLVPEDVDDRADAYLWRNGTHTLLTPGTADALSFASGMSEDGSRIFVSTPDALVANDTDGGQYDLYALRPGGGVLLKQDAAECTVACRPAGNDAPQRPSVGSALPLPNGNVVAPETQAVSRSSVSITVPKNARGQRATVRVKTNRPGTLRLSGKGLRATTVRARKAGTVSMTVRLTSFGRMQQRSRGRLSTRLTVRLTPTAGSAVSSTRALVVNANRKAGR